MDALGYFLKGLGLTGEAAIPLLLGALLCWGFLRIVHGNDNPIELWHFFATFNDRANREYGDINSLGMMAGIIVCLYTPMWVIYKTNDVNPWILGVCLAYLGGVKAFAAWLRNTAAKRYAGSDAADVPAPTTRELTFTTTDKTTTQEVVK